MRIIGYFPQWGIYDRRYLLRDVHSSGQAAKLTHLTYAFGELDEKGVCVMTDEATGDAWADYQCRFSTSESVDGKGDSYEQPLAGNFNQLRKLKKRHRHLKVGISFGGWGVPMAFAAQTGALPRVCWVLFIAAVLWALIYDTIYAMVDREDDFRIGVKSSAILFADMDRAIIGILQALRERDERPAYVGFDDFGLAEVFNPGVTVVRYDTARLGRAAVDLLLDRSGRSPRRVRVPVELVVRGSGEIPPPPRG